MCYWTRFTLTLKASNQNLRMKSNSHLQYHDFISIQSFKFDAVCGWNFFWPIKIFTYRCNRSRICLLSMNLCFVQICNNQGNIVLKIWEIMENKKNNWKSLVKVVLTSTSSKVIENLKDDPNANAHDVAKGGYNFMTVNVNTNFRKL